VQRLGRSLSHFERALRLPLRDPPLGRRLQARLRSLRRHPYLGLRRARSGGVAGLRAYRRAEACPLELSAHAFG